jgi:hypothetical protein
MTWARRAGSVQEQGRLLEARASEKIHRASENSRAARTVAQHANDAQDCASLLDMLGLDVLQAKRSHSE